LRLCGFFGVAVYFLLLLLLLWRCGSVLSWCLLVAGGVFWFCGLLGVARVVSVVCCFFWLVVWLCGSVRCFAPGVFCSSWLFGCWCVSPVRCTVLVLVAGSFGGSWFGCVSPPLFHDPGCSGPGFVLIAECHLVGVAVCGFVLFWFSACCFVLLLFFGLSRVSSSVSSR
jgi:hypothetical protein